MMFLSKARFSSFGILLYAVFFLFAPISASSQNPKAPVISAPPIREYPVLTENRLRLLREYMNIHYRLDSTKLDRPLMIVVHHTVTPTLAESLEKLNRDTLSPDRVDIAGHGDVNVGVHYIIDKDGTIYRLQPESVAGRHAIGFNWCSLGIEMVAADKSLLTEYQLRSCSMLIAWIVSRIPAIEYLIGHHEHSIRELPHFVLFREYDPTYIPLPAEDPGVAFMKRLRAELYSRYSIVLKN